MYTELFPIYGMRYVPFWRTSWFFYTGSFALGLAVLVLLVLVYRYIKRKKSVLPAWQEAIEKLQELHRKLGSGHITSEQAYDAMVQILKTYFSFRYATNIQGKTDKELPLEMYKFIEDGELIRLLEKICSAGILAKFAQQDIVLEVCSQDLNACISLVTKTIPTPECNNTENNLKNK